MGCTTAFHRQETTNDHIQSNSCYPKHYNLTVEKETFKSVDTEFISKLFYTNPIWQIKDSHNSPKQNTVCQVFNTKFFKFQSFQQQAYFIEGSNIQATRQCQYKKLLETRKMGTHFYQPTLNKLLCNFKMPSKVTNRWINSNSTVVQFQTKSKNTNSCMYTLQKR